KDIMKMPKNLQENALKTKNRAWGLTYLLNTIMIALAVGLLNRYETKKNFEKNQKNTYNPIMAIVKQDKLSMLK
ncbi:hypothetical protein IJ670_00770, partial [bacterium]|nr:hypothetical protein [bacterium]